MPLRGRVCKQTRLSGHDRIGRWEPARVALIACNQCAKHKRFLRERLLTCKTELASCRFAALFASKHGYPGMIGLAGGNRRYVVVSVGSLCPGECAD